MAFRPDRGEGLCPHVFVWVCRSHAGSETVEGAPPGTAPPAQNPGPARLLEQRKLTEEKPAGVGPEVSIRFRDSTGPQPLPGAQTQGSGLPVGHCRRNRRTVTTGRGQREPARSVFISLQGRGGQALGTRD